MDRGEILQGWLLHSRPFRDSSLVLDVFTRQQGRVSAIARGVRTAKSGGRRSLLQPFVALRLELAGRGELRTLAQVEQGEVLPPLFGEWLLSGLYINELLVRLLPKQEPENVLFAEYQALLQALAARAELEPLLRSFELLLLEALGYGLQLGHDMLSGEPLDPARCYALHEEGGFVASDADPLSRDCYTGATLLAMGRRDFREMGTRRVAKHLLRVVLQQHLGARELHSRGLFRRPGKLPPPTGPG
ncbi:MAG: hypothetical protein RLZZ169_994 [Pseudomonadota bacterium]|jgi:DNA repair protein RecO (recombination protein O)